MPISPPQSVISDLLVKRRIQVTKVDQAARDVKDTKRRYDGALEAEVQHKTLLDETDRALELLGYEEPKPEAKAEIAAVPKASAPAPSANAGKPTLQAKSGA